MAENANSQVERKLYVAKRITDAPIIDGYISEEVWDFADKDTSFIQYMPYNGKKPSQITDFRILYDDKALYVAAFLYDNSPDSIIHGLGRRDDAYDLNADQFVVDIGPYNDGINSFSFMVSSSGIQSDIKNYYNNQDKTWDAVWISKVRIREDGWIVEMKIPYSAIMFTQNVFQVWSLNVFRLIKRKEEIVSWNFIDRDIKGVINQTGELIGIKEVLPPLRLSVTPWFTGFLNNNQIDRKYEKFLEAGLDLKFGINQSSTLEAAILPDFEQVESDDKVLNISAYETKYDEKRKFFNDGNELFSNADIYYSRRIGLLNDNNHIHLDNLKNTEIVFKEPSSTKIVNATKLTGRTNNQLSYGILNTVSIPSYSIFRDTITGYDREVRVGYTTNYNVFVLDKSFENNSFVSIINTNFSRNGKDYIANVCGTDFNFSNRENSYAIAGNGAVSFIVDTSKISKYGFKSNIYLEKTSGKFQFTLANELISDKYDQNDMGYLPFKNEISNFLDLNYNIFDPFWKILSFKNSLKIRYTTLYSSINFVDLKLSANSNVLFNNHLSLNLNGFYRPLGNHDYYDARVEGRVFKKAPSFQSEVKLQTDPKKMVSLGLYHKYWGSTSSIGMKWNNYGIAPWLRFFSKFQLGLDSYYDEFINSIGFVEIEGDSIYMGKRDLRTISNTFSLIYSFSNKAWLSAKLRYYCSSVKYNLFYVLTEDGKLNVSETYNNNADIYFQNFNLDIALKWEFAPGSQISIVWKNNFDNRENIINENYFDNGEKMLNAVHSNSFSIRFLYYFDFLYFKKNGH
ncbi:MAG: carbohydrate binding family 9 domain-containing protein [Bacteroidales bacterium]|nr:carbohydrate binding family 9 domain-containing protein [Bacteroidales bacterium]MBN2756047.1 carbohydrate binding family 9 domain-containing protein [Bacteroidales bacterium]